MSRAKGVRYVFTANISCNFNITMSKLAKFMDKFW